MMNIISSQLISLLSINNKNKSIINYFINIVFLIPMEDRLRLLSTLSTY